MAIGHQTRPVLTVTLRAEDAIMTLDPHASLAPDRFF